MNRDALDPKLLRSCHTFPATVDRMDEATRVLDRLERIQELDRHRAPASAVLGELRALVDEAEAWARLEGDARARDAIGKLRREAEGMS
jgi:Tfp pilus assembly protein PilN